MPQTPKYGFGEALRKDIEKRHGTDPGIYTPKVSSKQTAFSIGKGKKECHKTEGISPGPGQ
eukprot:CAMPEP_0116897286 /NCGR_PEP_ID=MMETSP0467-20121206/6316_1 /TAXON_ID=283647 /ORGANISM="Mesodinium pulex, Strain SPMC105" /LENGTH=60 /DNA_ID=CAMNT_0004568877 /DNA_START=1874 /DNA_END=2056 /DNA_ORIENTATION=+